MGEIRNICLVGHSGGGKTALAEAILKRGGTEAKFDSSPEAKARGISIDLGLGYYRQGDKLINIIDTPGFGEFMEELYKGIGVAETAVLVLNAEKGVEVQTKRAGEIIADWAKPALAFINKMDLPNADFQKALDKLRELGGNFVPLQLPIRENGSFVGIVDLIALRAIYFNNNNKNKRGEAGEIPASLQAQVTFERERLLESLAETSDELMQKFLEGQEIKVEEIKAALKEGVKRRVLTPVLCGSATADLGIDLFIAALLEISPSFAEINPTAGDRLSSLVFNLTSDQYLGRLAFVKLYGGTLAEGDMIINLSKGAKERIRDIYRVLGDKQEKVRQAGAGEIVALAKLEAAALGDTLAASEDAPKLEFVEFPKPAFSRALEPLTQADEEKMSTALRELASTKATISISRDDVTKETILSGMGDTHLAVFAERLKNRFGVSVKMNRPRIPYKETIQKVATGQYRHKKQTGGRGQYGEVHLRVEPLPRGAGFEFVDEIKGGVIPNQFMPGVEKGVIEALQTGVLAGYPIVDVRVAAYYGSHHPVDSSEIAFKIAAARALTLAVQNASPVLLEPIMKLTIWAPQEFTGDIISSLNGKRGRILGMELEKIEAEAPLSEILDYALELKSLTQGQATFQMEFLKYQPVTSEKLAEELLKREKRGEPTNTTNK